MKKGIRRWMTVGLVLTLVLSMTVAVSAASVTFERLGATWTAMLNRNGRNDATYKVDGCGMYEHVQGKSSQVYYHGDYAKSHSASYSKIPSDYSSYIWDLFDQEDLQLSGYASGNSYYKWYDVDADEPSGYYRMAVVFRCYDAVWSVTKGITVASIEPMAVVPASSGTFTKAATDVWEFKPVLETESYS